MHGPKVFNLYAKEIKTNELKIHAEGLSAREVLYDLSWLSPKFYLPDFFHLGLTLGFYWYRVWLLAEPRSSVHDCLQQVRDALRKRVVSPCINYMQYPWGYAVPVRICITRESYHQYPWVISSVPVRVCITRESYHQYLWGYAVPVSHILSTCESYPQYPWGYAVPMSHIISTRESYPQYREDMQYSWVISSVPMSHILSTREDMQYPWVNLYEWRMNETSLTGTAYAHRYCISSPVLRIWLTCTEDMTHGYCISSRVLRIWLTGTEDMTHRYWWYDSQVLHIVYTGWV